MDYTVRTAGQLGQILQALRKEAGWTQKSVADRSGLLQKTVSVLEREPERATVRSLLALVAALDADLVVRPRVPAHDEQSEAW